MAIKPINNEPRTELQFRYQRFWKRFNDFSAQDKSFCAEFKPHPYADVRSYQDYAVSMGPYHLCAGINFNRHECKVAVYFRDVNVWDIFYNHHREDIEGKIGNRLIWSRHRTKGSAIIVRQKDFDETTGWEVVFQQMISDLIMMKDVFLSISDYTVTP